MKNKGIAHQIDAYYHRHTHPAFLEGESPDTLTNGARAGRRELGARDLAGLLKGLPKDLATNPNMEGFGGRPAGRTEVGGITVEHSRGGRGRWPAGEGAGGGVPRRGGRAGADTDALLCCWGDGGLEERGAPTAELGGGGVWGKGGGVKLHDESILS